MDMEIKKERDTPLLGRKRYILEFDSKGATPSRMQLRDLVATQLKADKQLTVIKHVYPRYGIQKVRVIAQVYDKKEDMLASEAKGLLEKHAKKEAPKKEEAAPATPAPAKAPAEEKEEAPAEKPAEEKKE